MDLWLVRHGEAVPASVDLACPLSAEGERAVSAVAVSLAGEMGRLDLVAASRKRRARQTAEILGAAAGYPVDRIEETEALSPDASPERFLAFLEENRDKEHILCVGHLPSIARIASFLLPKGDPVNLVFGPASVCRIRLSLLSSGEGELLFSR
jgi:phosphohistidine phosphatase